MTQQWYESTWRERSRRFAKSLNTTERFTTRYRDSYPSLQEHTIYAKYLFGVLQEIEDIRQQIASQGVNIEVDGIAPDVAELLRQIRAQYEAIVIQNRDEAEAWYKKKVTFKFS